MRNRRLAAPGSWCRDELDLFFHPDEEPAQSRRRRGECPADLCRLSGQVGMRELRARWRRGFRIWGGMSKLTAPGFSDPGPTSRGRCRSCPGSARNPGHDVYLTAGRGPAGLPAPVCCSETFTSSFLRVLRPQSGLTQMRFGGNGSAPRPAMIRRSLRSLAPAASGCRRHQPHAVGRIRSR